MLSLAVRDNDNYNLYYDWLKESRQSNLHCHWLQENEPHQSSILIGWEI